VSGRFGTIDGDARARGRSPARRGRAISFSRWRETLKKRLRETREARRARDGGGRDARRRPTRDATRGAVIAPRGGRRRDDGGMDPTSEEGARRDPSFRSLAGFSLRASRVVTVFARRRAIRRRARRDATLKRCQG